MCGLLVTAGENFSSDYGYVLTLVGMDVMKEAIIQSKETEGLYFSRSS